MIRKIQIGKNSAGWYVALPKWWGGYDVIEAIPSHEAAVAIADRYTFAARFLA